MAGEPAEADDNVKPTGGEGARRGRLSPRQVAALIRGLDSRLVNITVEEVGAERTLVYTFELAGKLASFRLPLLPEASTESIVDFYREAEAQERELLERFGIEFQQPSAV